MQPYCDHKTLTFICAFDWLPFLQFLITHIELTEENLVLFLQGVRIF